MRSNGCMSQPTGDGSRPPRGLRGVLFDSGDVLVRPTSPNAAPATEAWRRWFGGPRFVATIHAHLPGLGLEGADRAFDAGMAYLDERHRQPLRTVAEERERFTVFYRIVLEVLGVQDPPPALLRELVEGDDDEIAYQRLGLRPRFHAFVISSQEARLKDDPELFAIAAGRMELPPGAMLFVDDWPPHVQTALGVGFRGVVLDRNAEAPAVPGLTYLRDLRDVERLVTAARA